MQSTPEPRANANPGSTVAGTPQVNQINPGLPLVSILRASGLEPGERLACAVKLLLGMPVWRFATEVLQVHPAYLSRSIKDEAAASLQERAAAALGLERADIWPPARAA